MFENKQIIYNGNYLSEKENDFFVSNRAFLYGDSIFETMFVRNGAIHFFNDHMNRLISGMKILGYEIPDKFTVFRDKFEDEIIKLLNKNRVFKTARLRLTVFRKSGGLYTPKSNDSEYIIASEELENENYTLNETGFLIDDYKELYKPVNLFSQYKTANSLIYTLAGMYKTKNKLDECLIYNDKGNITESISSNIFMVINNTLYTPQINEGCINGIIRNKIINMAKQYNIECIESQLTVKELQNADEVFLTNSITGIRWVVAYKEKRYFKKLSNFFIHRLNEFYH